MIKDNVFVKRIIRLPIIKKIINGTINSFIYFFSLTFFIKDLEKFKKLNDSRFSVKIKDIYPCLKDRTIKTNFDKHYIYHTAWAARILSEVIPDRHIDISSSLYFSTLVSAFIPTDFYDYRTAEINLTNLNCKHANITTLPFKDSSVQSLSCMHVVEHIGLGRYGDSIDPIGDIKAVKELKRVLAKGGDLLFVVPVGKPRIFFNAHRVYSFQMVMEFFNDLILKEFSLISGFSHNNYIIKNATEEQVLEENYGCGCFWFNKSNL